MLRKMVVVLDAPKIAVSAAVGFPADQLALNDHVALGPIQVVVCAAAARGARQVPASRAAARRRACRRNGGPCRSVGYCCRIFPVPPIRLLFF